MLFEICCQNTNKALIFIHQTRIEQSLAKDRCAMKFEYFRLVSAISIYFGIRIVH